MFQILFALLFLLGTPQSWGEGYYVSYGSDIVIDGRYFGTDHQITLQPDGVEVCEIGIGGGVDEDGNTFYMGSASCILYEGQSAIFAIYREADLIEKYQSIYLPNLATQQ